MRKQRPVRRQAPPSRLVELTITQIGARGDGVARLGDDQVFVPMTVPGDTVVARIDGKRGDGLSASLTQLVTSSPDRAQPQCPHFGVCGGCSLQHLDDALYVRWKRDLLLTQLSRQGIDLGVVGDLIRVPLQSRRRANLTFVRPKGQVVLGFNERASHRVVGLTTCLLLDPAILAAMPALADMLRQTVAESEDGEITVTVTEAGLDVLVMADARLDLFDRENLAAFADRADLARLSWRRPGQGFIDPIARRRPAVVRFAQVAVEPVPGAFLQPTKAGEGAIAEQVMAAMPAKGTVADLYSGCGSFTFPLAAAGLSVHAFESEDLAVRALEAAANAAQLPISAHVRDLVRRPLLPTDLKPYAALVFDPPRAGAAEQAEHLARSGPPIVVAVSCNPATLARDLRQLIDGGYQIRQITPIDQFPFTAHLEAVAVLHRGT